MIAIAQLEGSWGLPPDVSASISARSKWPPGDDTSITTGARLYDLFERINEAAAAAARDNWDGDGARAVEYSTVEFAYSFAEALPANLPLPDISAENDGDLAFDWYFGPRRVFSVSIRRDGILNFAGLDGSARDYGSNTVLTGIPARVIELISRVSR